jgi:two-component system sensor histidine kinase SenX3
VNPLGAAAVLVAGILLGVLATWLHLRRPAVEEPPTFDDAPPVVPEGVSEILAVLSSSAVVVGPHDEVLEATPAARLLGLARGSRVGVPDLLDLVRQARRDGRPRVHDLELSRGPSDPTLYLSARVAAMPDGLVVILADDLTASHRIEATRRDFVANVSHELKTPIGAISLLAEAVEDAADDPDAVRRFAGRMGIESGRLADLVSQIIDLSRLQADDPLAEPQVVDIDQVLHDAVDRCRVDAEQRGVTLTLASAHGARVLGNARQLSTAVGNLVENAVVYSDPGARVVVAAHVRAHDDDDDVEITVSDTGIGISPAEAERIFERFYRVDYGRSRANGGTGLGLSIVKHIAASHGGRVGVWSQVGRGSTFTITLPAHLAQPGAEDHQGREAHPEEDAVQQAAERDTVQDHVEKVRS